MIPRVIHYCWFGRKPLPKSAKKCIASWKKYFPGYEIKEWNEDNYDVNINLYTRQAYEMKKYAFVSDFARFDILYREGGIYFDTDVEVIKNFDDILKNGAFMGCEIDGDDNQKFGNHVNPGLGIAVAPGLGIAVAPGLGIYKEIIDFYQTQSFVDECGEINTETVVTKTTNVLKKYGLRNTKEIQKIEGITIYPKEYFNPLNNNTGKLDITENTHSIHWYSMTWLSTKDKIRNRLTRPFHRLFGNDFFYKIGLKK